MRSLVFLLLLLSLYSCKNEATRYQKSVDYIKPDKPRRFALDKMRYYFRPEEWYSIKKHVDKIIKKESTAKVKEKLEFYSEAAMSHVDHFIPYRPFLSEKIPSDSIYFKWVFGDGLLRQVWQYEEGKSPFIREQVWYANELPILGAGYHSSGKIHRMVWANYKEGDLYRLLHLWPNSNSDELSIKRTSFIDYSYFGLTKNRYDFSQVDGQLESFHFNIHGLILSWTRNSRGMMETIKSQLERYNGVEYPAPMSGEFFQAGLNYYPVYPSEKQYEAFQTSENAQKVRVQNLENFYHKLGKEQALKVYGKFREVLPTESRPEYPERIWYAPRYMGFYHTFDDIGSYCTYSPKDSLNHWRFHYRGKVMTEVYQIKDGIERISEKLWYNKDDHAFAKAWYDPDEPGHLETAHWAEFKDDNPVHVYRINLGIKDYEQVFPSGSNVIDYSKMGFFRNQYSFWIDGKLSYANFEMHGMTIFYNSHDNSFKLESKGFDLPWSVRKRSWGYSNFRFPYSTD